MARVLCAVLLLLSAGLTSASADEVLGTFTVKGKLGMSGNTRDSAGRHVMLLAAMMCSRGSPGVRDDILLALLGAKGDVNAADQNKTTAFIWAAEACAASTVQALIDAGAKVNATTAGGGTALVMATALGRTETVDVLKRAGAK